ncbi:MAG: TRIC cation channel family protein [Eggerthellaceae bacterium]|nr:TRIC cation channel family protein [Eggerthellaceae bacterium]
MLEYVLAVPFWLELAAALTGGISGAMSAVRVRYDIFGTVCIAVTAGLCGGIIRDLLLQDYGIYAFQRPMLIVCCVAAGILVFFFRKLISHLDPILKLLDNVSCALWAVISVGKGLSAGLDIIPSIILGTITAIGGGVARDLLLNKRPEAFQAGALYGSAALVGSIVFAILKYNHLIEYWAPFIGVAFVLAVRYASLLFGWKSKPPTDYSDVVTQTVAKPVKAVARRAHIQPERVRNVAKRIRTPKSKIRQQRKRKPDPPKDDPT